MRYTDSKFKKKRESGGINAYKIESEEKYKKYILKLKENKERFESKIINE